MSAMIEVMDTYPIDGYFIEESAAAECDALFSSTFERLRSLQMESEILLHAKDTGVLVLEDVTIGANANGPATQKNVKGVFAHIQDFLGKIIKFLGDALSNFVEGITNSMSSAEEWYNANSHHLDNIPSEVYNTMKLSCIPYWEYTKEYTNLKQAKMPYNKPDLKSILYDANGKENLTADQIFSTYFPDLAKLDQDPRKAAFAFYQGAPANKDTTIPQMKNFTGYSDCSRAIQSMRAFFSVYKSLVTTTQTCVKNNIAQMEKVKSSMEKAGISTEEEGYVFGYDLYSAVAEDSITHFCRVQDKYGNPAYEAFLPIIEADVNANAMTGVGTGGQGQQQQQGQQQGQGQQQQQGQAQGQQQQQQTQSKKVTPKKMNGKKVANQTSATTGQWEVKYKETNKVFNICATIGTARMSALKNIADHYVTTLQQLVAGIKKYKGIQDEDTKNKAYNKNQAAREKMARDDEIKDIQHERKAYIESQPGFVKRTKLRIFG